MLVASVMSALFACSSANSSISLPVQAFYSAKFPDSRGSMQALNQWRGKVIVVNFWATWCPPCRAEIPELSELQDMYTKQGLIILGIATDDVDKIHDFSMSTKVSYPLLAGDSDNMSLSASMGNKDLVLPFTVVIDQDGHIVKTFLGRINKSSLEETLLPLLRNTTTKQ